MFFKLRGVKLVTISGHLKNIRFQFQNAACDDSTAVRKYCDDCDEDGDFE